MVKYPNGAFRSAEEVIDFYKGQESAVIYLVDDDHTDRGGVLVKTIITPPYIDDLENKRDGALCVAEKRYLDAINLSQLPHQAFAKNFCFHNYWDALAYSLQCKAKEKVSG